MTNTSNTSSRDELARDIFLADNSSVSEGIAAANWNITIAQAGDKGTYAHNIADGLIAKGYRKPVILGYVVVGRDGRMMRTEYPTRDTAQAVADEWNTDAKNAEVDWEYRVAEIVEATR